MILATGCLAEKALHGEAISEALEALGLDRVLLCAGKGRQPSQLSGLPVAGVACSWDDRQLGLQVAKLTGTRRLVLAPDTDWDVETACRELFELGRRTSGLELVLSTPVEGALADAQAVEMVLDDLAANQLGYWHHPSRVLLAGQEDVTWLDRLGRRLVGLSLDDVAAGRGGLPPGVGELDLERLADLTGRSLVVTLDTDPLPDVALLRLAVNQLKALGFS